MQDAGYPEDPTREHIRAMTTMLVEREESAFGMVYAIAAVGDGAFKIGWSENPLTRVKDLQTGNHRRLRIFALAPAPVDIEAEFHNQLADERIRREWFEGPSTNSLVRDLRTFAAYAVEHFEDNGTFPDIPWRNAAYDLRYSRTERAAAERSADRPPSFAVIDSVERGYVGKYNLNPGRGRTTSGVMELEEMRVEGKLPLYIRRNH